MTLALSDRMRMPSPEQQMKETAFNVRLLQERLRKELRRVTKLVEDDCFAPFEYGVQLSETAHEDALDELRAQMNRLSQELHVMHRALDQHMKFLPR